MKFMVGERAIVTGGAGFIGSHLVEQLVAGGVLVTVFDDLSTGSLANLSQVNDRIEFKELDIREADWKEILKNTEYDTIFHLAANAYVPPSVEHPDWDFSINLVSTFRLLETLRQISWAGKLIYASSAAVYGNPTMVPMNEGCPLQPLSPYGVGKLAAERYLAVFSQLYGLRAASLRFFSVFGPRQHKQVVFDLISKIRRDPSRLFIYGDGSQLRDFNYVEDTAQALILVAERGALQGEVYNVASGDSHSIKELAETLCRVMDVDPEFVYSGDVRPGDADKWVADISFLQSLGYESQVSFQKGLQKVVNWHREVVKIKN